MNKLMLLFTLGIIALAPAHAMAQTLAEGKGDTIDKVVFSVEHLKTLADDIYGKALFDIINEDENAKDYFDPFVFIFDATDLAIVSSSEYPELVGNSTFDISNTPYTIESLNEKLDSCDGLWVYHEFSPDGDTTIREILYISKLYDYGFASGFFLQDLPEWLDEIQLEYANRMVLELNERNFCATIDAQSFRIENLNAKLSRQNDRFVITGTVRNIGASDIESMTINELTVGPFFKLRQNSDIINGTPGENYGELYISGFGFDRNSCEITVSTTEKKKTPVPNNMTGCGLNIDAVGVSGVSTSAAGLYDLEKRGSTILRIIIDSGGSGNFDISESMDFKDELTISFNVLVDGENQTSNRFLTAVKRG